MARRQKISRADAEKTKHYVEQGLVQGMTRHQACIYASKEMGIPRQTIWSRIVEGGIIDCLFPDLKVNFDIKPDISYQYQEIKKPKIIVKVSRSPEGEAYKICVIGDTHDSPVLPDKARFRWIARHICKTRPDKVVHIGDMGDFESCSTHAQPGSQTYSYKPSFKQDMESLEDALAVFHKELGSHSIPLLLTEGNHEYRIDRWEEGHPETQGILKGSFYETIARYGWKAYAFGEWVIIGGVGFSHVPKNIMGKPYGGKFSENQIGNDAIFSIVYGHTHRAVFRRVPKIGPMNSIEILNVGSAMPDGYVAPYANTSTTGWTYGIYDIKIRAGHIEDYTFHSMQRLQEQYGD
jgi:hypothetical protein